MKPILVFDGDCGFCRLWVDRIRCSTGDRVDYAPYQKVAENYPQIPLEEFEQTVQWIGADGRHLSGAKAAFKLLSFTGSLGRGCLWVYRHLPGFAPISECVYRLAAENRRISSALTHAFWGNNLRRPTYAFSSTLFLRALGIVYLIAILSLWVQIEGLIGSKGILPIGETLRIVQNNYGSGSYFQFPTLFWIESGDSFLHFVCGAGVLFALLGILTPASRLPWIMLCVLYLSLAQAGSTFLGFQWDALLLEVGFLSLFLPQRLLATPREGTSPSRLVEWLFRWLLFRLMFGSGIVKITSNDESWRSLTALSYHYETQPIPNSIAWFFHNLPDIFHKVSLGGMFFIELLIPVLIFAPRRLKHLAFGLLVLFQISIALTGNYTYFNVLSIALCLWLLDDRVWRRVIPTLPLRSKGSDSQLRVWVTRSYCAVVILLSAMLLLGSTFRLVLRWPSPLREIQSTFAPFMVVNYYGLFAIMTTSRPEIIIEGSDDGATWKAYEFPYKPGDLRRAPPFVAPHQPRLDWQMWFAALGNVRANRWFMSLCTRLLAGSEPVLRLFEHNPFPEAPPRILRARLFDYRFTTPEERAETGHWWKREYLRDYLPPSSLRVAQPKDGRPQE